MEEVINNHLQRMKNLQSVYEERTGQHNILGILINELTEQLRQYNVVRQSEQLNCVHEWKVEVFDCYGFPISKYCEKCDIIEAI